MTKHIPNTITCLNLLSGCLAVIFAFAGNFQAVVLCVALSALFDFAMDWQHVCLRHIRLWVKSWIRWPTW